MSGVMIILMNFVVFCHLYIFIGVLLLFQDMVAFSCCEYDGGKEEKKEMERVRARGWRGKFRRKGRVITPRLYRINGKCPLTPLEVYK